MQDIVQKWRVIIKLNFISFSIFWYLSFSIYFLPFTVDEEHAQDKHAQDKHAKTNEKTAKNR